MKKPPLLLLALTLLLSVSLAFAETDGDFSYAVRDGKAVITAYTGSAAELIVPDTLGGYPVRSIGICAFMDCRSLTRVTLADGITAIASNAFDGCASLSHVNLPDSLATIGTHAFYGCAKLTQLTLPDSLERIHPYAFYGCSAARLCSLGGQAARVLTDFGCTFTSPDYPLLALKALDDGNGHVTLTVADCDESAVRVAFPDGITAIDGYAFFGCTDLTEIEIPDGVSEIPYSAFEGCTALRQVTLPDSVVRIADNAFFRCPLIILIAPEGSAAQTFAEANDFTWRKR